MGLMARVSTIFKSKVNTVLDKAEDPRETLEYSYQKQVEQLQNIRRGIAEVVTSKKRLELQMSRLQQSAAQQDENARDAVRANRDDLAQEALARKQGLESQMAGLQTQIDDLAREEARLTDLQQKLQTKVESFRTQKEVIKAQYSAAQAQVKIGEAFTGLGEDMTDVNMALQRAQDKTESLKARAAAVDALSENPAFQNDALPSSGDSIRDELNKLKASSSVSDELAKLKAELGQGDNA
ncbi:MAG: phage shock protein A [Sulfobacillus acidophilus]|uniref:Phage shock protein A n=1 Tax=Sulfobacillus acidophilus TaxID=53633 RepID=A0A2T2WK53_9FIRM|nr:MAG: phage shock protein A [Sulfobacillus acidophilus]